MECPKCRHKIYIDLSLEDLIFCPYCEERMVPPKEFNLCPVCAGELPAGAAFCLKCGEKLVPEEATLINHEPTEPPGHSREDISALVNEEPPPVQEPEPPFAPDIEEIPAQMPEEPFAEEKAAEPPPVVFRKDIPAQPVHEEPVLIERVPPEPQLMGAPQPISLQRGDEPPVINLPGVQTSEPWAMPAAETIPTPVVEEELPPAFEQPEAVSVPVCKDVPPAMKKESAAATREQEDHAPGYAGETVPEDEFAFCIACGRKLPSDALFCPRCGKSIQTAEIPVTKAESARPAAAVVHEEVVRAEKEEPRVMEEPPVSSVMPAQTKISEKPVAEPEPIPIHYVQPKYAPVESREEISKTMDDFAPSLPHFPKAETAPDAGWKQSLFKIRGWLADAGKTAWDFIKGQQKGFRELFDKLFEEREIKPVDLSSAEAMKQVVKVGEPPVPPPIPLSYIILGVVVFIAFFIIIGITVVRCTS